jgi:hypothetical protein
VLVFHSFLKSNLIKKLKGKIMSTESDIINKLSNKTKTLGWDAVVAYDRDKVNHLLEQQYISKLAGDEHFHPVSWASDNKSLQVENLTLSAPLISFEDATTETSKAKAVLEFIDGNVIERNTDGQVTNYIRVRPGMGYGMVLSIDLTVGKGSVDNEGKVLIDFSAASISLLEMVNDPPPELLAYFQQWLANNPVIYELGQISMNDLGTHLTPKKFIIRTQNAPASARRVSKDRGYGAVLLFIATDFHPGGGDFPSNNYPWLIPQERSSAILISNRVVMESYVKAELDSLLTTGSWNMVRDAESNDDAYYLKASDNATIRQDYLRTEPKDKTDYTWSGKFKGVWGDQYGEVHEDFIFSLKKAKVVMNQGLLSIDFDRSNVFGQQFAANLWHHACGPSGCISGDYHERATLDITVDGSSVYDLQVSADKEAVAFTFKNSSIDVSNDFAKKLGGYAMAKSIGEEVSRKLDDKLQASTDYLEKISFDDINVFAVNHVLFPEQNINRLESAYFPGDVVIFGDINPSLTSLQLTPLTSTVAAGGTLQFTTNVDSKKVEYSLYPADSGSISETGLYHAPTTINGSVVNVKVTATTEDGSSSALIKVLPQSVQVSPTFFNLNEASQKGVSLRAFFVGNGNTLKEWRLESSVPGLTGNIASDGFYTPPEVDLPLGYTYVTATAISTDGSSSSALILLVSKDTHAEFKVTPSLITNLPAGSVQTLSANSSLDFDPNKWSNYPAVGTLSEPIKDGSEYTVEYTSSADAKGGKLVIISAIQDGRPHRAGYSLIDVANFHN